MSKRHPNEFLRTWTGRLAGSGILYDRYDEESMPSGGTVGGNPIYTEEYTKYIKSLKDEQPVTVYKLGKEELKKYLKEIGVKPMTRFEKFKNMTVEQMAKAIIDSNITDDFCKSDCVECEDIDCECLHELECCVRWLEEGI